LHFNADRADSHMRHDANHVKTQLGAIHPS